MSDTIRLTPQQAAVVSAYERVANALAVESAQLAHVWGQQGASNELLRLRAEVDRLAKRHLDDCSRVIEIAREMPKPEELVLAAR